MSAAKGNANAFSPTTMIALVLVSLVCLTGMALLSSYEPELKSGNDGAAHALSKSSLGYSGLQRVLDGSGQSTVFSRRDLTEGQERSTLVIAPEVSTQPSQLLDFGHYGPMVILLPKWYATADDKKRGWSKLVAKVSSREALSILPEDMLIGKSTTLTQSSSPQAVRLVYRSFVKNSVTDLGTTQPVTALRVIAGEKWVPVVAGPDGGAVIAKHVKENVYIVADPDLFNNAGISNITNARLAAHFMADIRENKEPIIFDLTLNGFQRQPNLGRVALEPPILGATLCLLLAAILTGLQAGVRFLPPRSNARVVALGKRGLADNTAGLVRMGKREHRMALPYAHLIKRQVAKAISAPTNLDPVALVATLDKVAQMSKSQFRLSTLLAEAGAANNAVALVKVAKDLHLWKQETTRERQ
jgi:hypothetical protein